MRWPQGHEKIISFGVAIKVDGKAAGVWCYSAELKEDCAVYRGIPMTWEEWSPPIMAALDFHKAMGESKSQLFKCGARPFPVQRRHGERQLPIHHRL